MEQFLKRPIECEIRYLFIDAAYFKVREDVRYVNKAHINHLRMTREDGHQRGVGDRAKLFIDGGGMKFWVQGRDKLQKKWDSAG